MSFVRRVMACVATWVAVIAALMTVGSGAAIASSGVPYTDDRVVGSIGLCNAAGQAVTKGSIHDTPFIAKAIDSTPAAAPYNGAGETATLFIYQPRQGIPAAEWHGEQLGASSRSTTPQHPTAILTAGDGPLSGALSDYPPKWDGFMQLRIYLGAPSQPTFKATYDATNIKVTGDTWEAVGGASIPCGDGQSVSLEQVLSSAFPQLTQAPSQVSAGAAGVTPNTNGTSGNPAKAGAGTSAGSQAPAGAASGAGSVAPNGSLASAAASSGAATSAGASAGKHNAGTSIVLWALVGVGVVGAGALAVQWRRSRPVPRRHAA